MTRFRSSRAKRFAIGVALATFIVGVPWLAIAVDPLPHRFENGDVIDAEKINENFAHLRGAIEEVEMAAAVPVQRIVRTNLETGLSTSLHGTFCGASDPFSGRLTDGARTGYAAAKSICEDQCGSATAHMCHGSEILTSKEVGIGVPSGWYSNFQTDFGESLGSTDCRGWTVGTGSAFGPRVSEGNAAIGACSTTLAVLCCD